MSGLPPLSFERVIKFHDWDVASGKTTWPVSKAVRRAIYSRDNNRCYYCASPHNLSLDHKVPQSVGGSNRSTNLVTACKSCNSAKGPRPLDWFLKHLNQGSAA